MATKKSTNADEGKDLSAIESAADAVNITPATSEAAAETAAEQAIAKEIAEEAATVKVILRDKGTTFYDRASEQKVVGNEPVEVILTPRIMQAINKRILIRVD